MIEHFEVVWCSEGISWHFVHDFQTKLSSLDYICHWESSLHRMIFLRPQAVKLRVAVAFVFADDFLEGGYVEV